MTTDTMTRPGMRELLELFRDREPVTLLVGPGVRDCLVATAGESGFREARRPLDFDDVARGALGATYVDGVRVDDDPELSAGEWRVLNRTGVELNRGRLLLEQAAG